MMKIFKYQPNELGQIELPRRHKVLSVQLQNNEPTIWAAVDDKAEKEVVYFYALPTGSVIKEDKLPDYQATLVGDNGLVWHVFIRR